MSTKSNFNDVAYKNFKKNTSKIINLDLNKKIVSKHLINTGDYYSINNIDSSKSNEKDKKKIISSFNSILNITNNKSRNILPNKNSLENKTAENLINTKIFSSNQRKPELNKNKDIKNDNMFSAKMASIKMISRNINNEKNLNFKSEQQLKISKYRDKLEKTIKVVEIKKVINTSNNKTKILPMTNIKSKNINKFNSSNNSNNKKVKNNEDKVKNVFNTCDKSMGDKKCFNFFNISKNSPIVKKI